ncbi:unnamed protein product [Pieris brassicae]|uniref:Uncharacterized protein n=1 Tax=Pieris brassicae TaxID=7116 RepID=A0A9P0TAY1_PIEBR|nr:unnamed protein product [Pieris brassicae]
MKTLLNRKLLPSRKDKSRGAERVCVPCVCPKPAPYRAGHQAKPPHRPKSRIGAPHPLSSAAVPVVCDARFAYPGRRGALPLHHNGGDPRRFTLCVYVRPMSHTYICAGSSHGGAGVSAASGSEQRPRFDAGRTP